MRNLLAALFCLVGAVAIPVDAQPLPGAVDELPFQKRIVTETADDLTVTIAVPTRDEAIELYGVDLAKREMQPIWIEVKNHRNSAAWLLSSGIDPDYFSASEAAYPFRSKTSEKTGPSIEAHFSSLQFSNPIPPDRTRSGFIIVNRDEGFKAVDIDIISSGQSNSFSFSVVDPSFKGDFTQVNFSTLYQPDEITDIKDEASLRRILEELPCCATNKKGTAEGDPLNLAVIGSATNIFSAFIRRGWHGTETLSMNAMMRTAKSFLAGSRYRYSPISPLYVFGRRQDIALQKARGTINERNHLRLWLTPFRFRGQGVWIGQISRDIGVKFTLKSPTISTHVIDPDVDEARRYLIEDLAYSQTMARLGYTGGVGVVYRDAPRYNLIGDPFYTDGLRAVMFFDRRPYSLDDIAFIGDWEIPPKTHTPASSSNP